MSSLAHAALDVRNADAFSAHAALGLTVAIDGSARPWIASIGDAAAAVTVADGTPPRIAALTWRSQPARPGDAGLACLLERLFADRAEASAIVVDDGVLAALGVDAAVSPLVHGRTGASTPPSHAIVRRDAFYQLPWLWHRASRTAYPTFHETAANGLAHPHRPSAPRGVIYDRRDPVLGRRLAFRRIDPQADLDLFHGWMNQARVAFYWELAQPRDELQLYLERQAADPHIYGVIALLDGEPSGYFEIYWAKEDRLGPHYDADDYDRGWHGLIGNPAHLGRDRTAAWFRAVTHFLFLDEPRTRRVVGEPRASHVRMLRYASAVAYDKVKEFDFPHKRAALMVCARARFFREVRL